MYKDRGNAKFFAELYQLAGDLTLGGDWRSEGEKARLRELLLDALSQPNEWSAQHVRIKRELAVMK